MSTPPTPPTPFPTQPLPKIPHSFMQAVAREEGFYLAHTRPQRNNNPGDIEWGKFTQAHGATAGDPRFAIFNSADDGFACMRALFQSNGYKGLTVSQALNRWAPPVENQTNAYIANVCKWTGLTPDTVIDAILDGPSQAANSASTTATAPTPPATPI
ncbi:MAG: hypothetical protein ABI197_01855 [Granulicella sp.]